jgi:hypothetical protein
VVQAAPGDGVITIAPAKRTAGIGRTFTFKVLLNTGSHAIHVWEIALHFPKTLACSRITIDPAWSQPATPLCTAGVADVVGFDLNRVSGSGLTAATFTFKAVRRGTPVISISTAGPYVAGLYDADTASPIPFTSNVLRVTVK